MPRFLVVILFAFAFIQSFSPVHAQVDPNLNQRLQQGAIVINHDDIILFNQIPQTYLDRAKNIRVVFSDRSVGQNVNEALDCLAANSWAESGAACRRDYTNVAAGEWRVFTATDFQNGTVPDRILFNAAPGKYSRSNWTFELKSGSWSELTQDFIQTLGPAYINTKDVLTYQFSYLNVDTADSIANIDNGFFANTTSYDIYDLETYWSSQPTKVFPLWTSSLARIIGTIVATNFNNQMRNYVQTHHRILLDFADIESHLDAANGYTPCLYNGQPNLCPDYTTESSGGHLGSVSAGKIMVGKAFWLMMAQIAGWNPGGTSPTPTTRPPTPTTTPIPPPPTYDFIDLLGVIRTFGQTIAGNLINIFDFNAVVDNL